MTLATFAKLVGCVAAVVVTFTAPWPVNFVAACGIAAFVFASAAEVRAWL